MPRTRGPRTHFDVAAVELVVAAEAGEDPGVPTLPREAAEGVGRHGLAHDDRDPVGIALGGLRRRSLRGLLVRGDGGRGWDEGARLLVVVGGGAHGENRREVWGSEASYLTRGEGREGERGLGEVGCRWPVAWRSSLK